MDEEKRKRIEEELEDKIWTSDSMSWSARRENAMGLAVQYVLGVAEASTREQRIYNLEYLKTLRDLRDTVSWRGKYIDRLPAVDKARRYRWKMNRIAELYKRAEKTDSKREQMALEESAERLDQKRWE
jgi:hypothetical protein